MDVKPVPQILPKPPVPPDGFHPLKTGQEQVGRGIVLAAQVIAERYPPTEWQLVGLGRSPVPFIESLRAEIVDGFQPQLLPISGLNSCVWLGPDELDKFYSHCDKFVDLTNRDNVVLVDYCITGKSLQVAQNIFKGYLQSRYPSQDTSLTSLAITGRLTRHEDLDFYVPERDTLDICQLPESEELQEALDHQAFDGFSPYNSVKVHLDQELDLSFGQDGFAIMTKLIAEAKLTSIPLTKTELASD